MKICLIQDFEADFQHFDVESQPQNPENFLPWLLNTALFSQK